MPGEITFVTGWFNELNAAQWYAILRLRSEVFVVEQDCVYQDIDNKDQQALHLLMYVGMDLQGYTRIFGPGAYFERVSIGRVVLAKAIRGKSLGKKLMNESISLAQRQFGPEDIEISAQYYLLEFYRQLGFKEFGEQYLEDNIPHIRMLRRSQA